MAQKCGEETLIGAIAATIEAGGAKIEPKTLEALPKASKQAFVKTMEAQSTAAYRAGGVVDINADKAVRSLPQRVLGVLHEQRNVSNVLGEEVVAPVQRFSEAHYAKYKDELTTNPNAGRKEWEAGIKPIIQAASQQLKQQEGSFAPDAAHHFSQYRKWLEGGGSFYSDRAVSDTQSLIGQVLGNVTNNVITGSFNVAVGNALESIKLPMQYGVKHSLSAALDTFKLGTAMFKNAPELEAKGTFYRAGVKKPEGLKKWLKTSTYFDITNALSVPLQHAAYKAGFAAGGEEEALRAVQRVTYFNRVGDPTFSQMQGNNEWKRLLGYTINTMRLYGSNLQKIALGSSKEKGEGLAALALWHGTFGLVAGVGGAAIQQAVTGEEQDYGAAFGAAALQIPVITPLFNALASNMPDVLPEGWSEFFNENENRLAQSPTVNSAFIGVDIAKSKMGAVGKSYKEAAKAFNDGDPTKGVIKSLKGLSQLLVFTDNALGSKIPQKAIDFSLDVLAEEEEWSNWKKPASKIVPLFQDKKK